MPDPAPVTIATLFANDLVMIVSFLWIDGKLAGQSVRADHQRRQSDYQDDSEQPDFEFLSDGHFFSPASCAFVVVQCRGLADVIARTAPQVALKVLT
jgi:hypothetical protein